MQGDTLNKSITDRFNAVLLFWFLSVTYDIGMYMVFCNMVSCMYQLPIMLSVLLFEIENK